MSCTRLSHSPVPPPWKDVVFGIRQISKKEVESFGRLAGSHDSGLEFATFTAEPVKFMPYMMKQFTDLGGVIVNRKIDSLKELSDFDVIVNCSGSGARQLVGDRELQPLRGQVGW